MFDVARSSSFVFKKGDLIAIMAIMFVIKSLKGYGWNNVGPASQAAAKRTKASPA